MLLRIKSLLDRFGCHHQRLRCAASPSGYRLTKESWCESRSCAITKLEGPITPRFIGGVSMAKFLVHVHTGPEAPTKCALGFLVALAALKEGHQVDLFLAGDGASLIGDTALSSVEGKGTGNLGAHFKALADGGARFYVSGMSAKARGLGDADLVGKPAEFAMPDVLVRLAASADVVLSY